jgi:NADH:ubiquinone oxidoreductase subunit 6 (subunit J)
MEDLQPFFFWVLAVGTGVCAVAVVVAQNIVRAATWLLFTLAGVSGIFFLIGADFVGATQLLVYVGGTLVLVVFGVMLTAQGPFITMRTGAAEWAVATGAGLLFLAVLVVSLLHRPWPQGVPDKSMSDAEKSMNTTNLGWALFGFQEATPREKLTGYSKGTSPPERKRVGYLLPFEIVSVHLLVVLLGAAYLARAKRRRTTAG